MSDTTFPSNLILQVSLTHRSQRPRDKVRDRRRTPPIPSLSGPISTGIHKFEMVVWVCVSYKKRGMEMGSLRRETSLGKVELYIEYDRLRRDSGWYSYRLGRKQGIWSRGPLESRVIPYKKSREVYPSSRVERIIWVC